MSTDETAVSASCSRCGKPVLVGGQVKNVQCSTCGRFYHKKCFMADAGVEVVLNGTKSQMCVCCLSTPIQEAKLMRSGYPNKFSIDFLKNGYCIVPLSSNRTAQTQLVAKLTDWRAEVVTYFHALMKTYECQAELGRSVPTLESGYSNFRQRCPGRFEIIATFISDEVVPLVENSQAVQETLNFLLCNPKARMNKKVMSSGCFLSLMGSETQNYHTDGPALSDVVDLFPYAVNVFVPLVPVDSRNGTEFIPGSQVVGEHEKTKSVRPSIPLGSALLFDYRVVHRGLRNSHLDPRPCYYATYSQSWYKDTYNFNEKRYRKQLEVSPVFLEPRSERMAKRAKVEKSE